MTKTPNTTSAAGKEPQADSDGLWTAGQAAAFLGIQKGSLAAAIQRHEYLKEASTKDTYPGLNIPRTRLRPDAVRRFAQERLNSPRATSGGLRRWTALMTEDERQQAQAELSKRLGREIRFETAYKRKDKSKTDNGVESDVVSSDIEPSDVNQEFSDSLS